MSGNGLPLKPVRASMAESLVKVQKIHKEPNDRKATKPALVISGG
jgi:PIN domain nuclease of toxin-antitoxin system